MNNETSLATSENVLEPYDGLLGPNVVLALTCAVTLFAIVWFSARLSIWMEACCPLSGPDVECSCCLPKDKRRPYYNVHVSHCEHFNFALAATFLLGAAILGLVFAISYKTLDAQDYRGLMRITNWTYTTERNRVDGGEYSDDYEWVVRAEIQLQWGYAWGCPGYSNKECHSSYNACSQSICVRDNDDGQCTEEEHEAAFRRAESCANRIFNRTGPVTDHYVPYGDPATKGPSQDENWPSVLYYGKCGSCEVIKGASDPDQLRIMRNIYIPCVILGLAWTGWSMYSIRRKHTCLEDEYKDQEPTREYNMDLHVEEAFTPKNDEPAYRYNT